MKFHHPLFLAVWLLIPVIWLMMRYSPWRDSRRLHRILVAGLRSLLILLAGFALADPRLLTNTDRVNLIFCVDRSESISRDKTTAIHDFIQQTLTSMDEQDQAGLIAFGKQPSLELSLRNPFEFSDMQSDINPNFTNLADALQLAIGQFPSVGEKKIVLFTDGNENIGEAKQRAALAASLGVQIWPVPVESWFGGHEVFVSDVAAPAAVPLETPYEISVEATSSHETEGELILLKNDALISSETVRLHAGKNRFVVTDQLQESGLYLYKAILNCPDDLIFQNNEGMAFVKGEQKSQVLYVADASATPSPLFETLQMQGLAPIRKTLDELSGSLHELLKYNAIIFDNVSGNRLSFTLMEHLETYVRDMGGGFIMLGGERSFGAGNYRKTPIESLLPVFMEPPTDVKFSGLCLVFIIDKSSSMSSRYTDKTKLELAKIAAFSSIELLNPTDKVGVVAFDSQFVRVVPVTEAVERQAIAAQLSMLKESGGTVMYPALEDAFNMLKETEASRKHVIILSDGITNPGDFESLVRSMAATGISVSTVAIGTDADQALMRSIAEWGQGRSYYTDNPDTIPRIFTGETKIVSNDVIAEATIAPQLKTAHDMLTGLTQTPFPTLSGQLITYPKPAAQIILNSPHGPILAAWQYGLGRSVAFTSDLGGRWGNEWVNWEHYGQFVGQMMKWAQRKETAQRYDAQITRSGDHGLFTVDVLDAENQFVNHLALNINMVAPSQANQTLALKQIAPGRYAAAFPAEEIGAYYFSLFGTQADDANRPDAFGFAIPYTDEFLHTSVNLPLLEEIATATGGKMLELNAPSADLFATRAGTPDDGVALWSYLVMAFFGILLADVATRKIIAVHG
ncbi:hypothetical protein U14_00238 [Candidatus Moduliflexus flocculans]|uniref:VWFA domain-containing protein n=1 Tax=Candidatus Moduliflexus flocculans TaxID=1499966 RepID=A0A0S6VTU4_9BACT|nr:hypothetical protein U14_00238 [Candidatus Moduliflexus flocculans]